MFPFPIGLYAGGAAAFSLTESGVANSTTNNTTVAFTVPAGGIPAGSLIVVVVGNGGTRVLTSAADTAGNTYGNLQVENAAGGSNVGIIIAHNVTALSSGNAITATLTGSSDAKSMWVGYITAAKTASAFDVKASAADTASTSPSSGATAATAQANEIAIGAVWIESSTVTVTEASGYTTLTERTVSTFKLHTAWKLLSSTGAQTYAPSLDASNDWACLVYTIKAA